MRKDSFHWPQWGPLSTVVLGAVALVGGGWRLSGGFLFTGSARPAGAREEVVPQVGLSASAAPDTADDRIRRGALTFSEVSRSEDREMEDEEMIRPVRLTVMRSTEAERPSLAPRAEMTDAEVWAHYEPSREELEYRGRLIEARAEKELQNLLRVVPLDEERQDRVFAALVQSSDWYHPALQATDSGGTVMRLGGSGIDTGQTVATIEDAMTQAQSLKAVQAELTPEEAGVYERYTSERTAFWAGVVEEVERQLLSTP